MCMQQAAGRLTRMKHVRTCVDAVDTERLSKLHCLLLGSGTLGCNIARSLLSWGVRKVTFLDYGRVRCWPTTP